MRESDVGRLLIYVNRLDGRMTLDDVKTQAWFDLFQQEAPRMDYDWAHSAAASHYAKTDDMLTPSHLVRGWNEYQKFAASAKLGSPDWEAHCAFTNCPCLHQACYKGWLNDVPADVAVPCPVCRPELAQRINSIPSPGNRQPIDMAKIRDNRTFRHEQSDYSKEAI